MAKESLKDNGFSNVKIIKEKRGTKMTNRDEFNQYIRNLLNEKIEYLESLSDEELVDFSAENPDAGISLAVGRELRYFKVTKAGIPVGTKDDVKSWLGEEE